MDKFGGLAVVVLSLLFLNAGQTWYGAPVTPLPPFITRKVSLVQNLTYEYAYAPPLRTSADGRVALSVKELVGGKLQFFALVPEAIDTAPAQTPFGLLSAQTPPQILPGYPSNSQPYTMPDGSFAAAGATQQHHTLCDGTMQTIPGQTTNTNPYTNQQDLSCPSSLLNSNGNSVPVDCYRLWVISSAISSNGSMILYQTPIVVQVKDPKKADASIALVQIDSTRQQKQSQPFTGYNQLLEPMITSDGHLLVGRVQYSKITWTGITGSKTGLYNIVYSAHPYPHTASPCDVTNWTQFYPIPHAYNDSNVHNVYGFADYPLKDSENNPIVEPYDIEGTYSWIDRLGRNLFFTNVAAGFYNPTSDGSSVMTRYEDQCPQGVSSCVSDPTTPSGIGAVEEQSATRGLSVVGRWTHGKIVQLDALVNNIDYGIQVPDANQRDIVGLYQNTNIRFGSGRYNDYPNIPPAYASNTTILDSFENLFTYLPTFRPVTMREVVWQLNMGKGGDEVAFDDYINPDALIISEMTASTTFKSYQLTDGNGNPLSPPFSTYNDGFSQLHGFTLPIHIQNSATSVRWNIPKYGVVDNSSGGPAVSVRIEPAALGGIKGKGLWLQENNYLDYPITSQPLSPLFISLFLDNRSNGTLTSRILTFPDGTSVSLVGYNDIQIKWGGGSQATDITPPSPGLIPNSATGGWWQLAFQVEPNVPAQGTTTVGVYVNGYLYSSFQTQTPLFQLNASSDLMVGGALNATGFYGWIDEFKVIAQDLTKDPETICNHAHGTLVGGTSSTGSTWKTISGYYPSSSHSAISSLLNNAKFHYTTYQGYACYHVPNYYVSDPGPYYSNPVVTQTPQMQQDVVFSVRNNLHFPEGPLVWNKYRPDSTGNVFCTSCHTDSTGQYSSTLQSPAALCGQGTTWTCTNPPSAVTMSEDQRRQPMHAPRCAYGTVPQNLVNNSLPTSNQTPPSSGGLLLDVWSFPDGTTAASCQ